MDLTPKQQNAVDAERSVAVTAGAGTGKTALLAQRFVHHVVEDGFSPLQIVAVTFTDKAAAELRSRIRAALLLAAGQDRADEADAAQISTIHTLAARICRDFYDLAGIPADFGMLDETDAEILLAEWFDESLAVIAPETVTGLGYSWLGRSLRELFKDPPAAGEALIKDEAALREFVDRHREDCILDLIASDAWRDTVLTIGTCKGSDKDAVEKRRQKTLTAMTDIETRRNVDDALTVLKGIATNHGTTAGWPNGGLTEVRDCLIALRDAFKKCVDERGVEFGDADREMCRRIALLKSAFESATEHIRQAKLERRLLDFADLEHYALKALEHAKVRAHYADRWKAFLIDEFQDTNPVQERLINALTGAGVRLTIVGDEKQSIYGFRRADPRVFQRFRDAIDNEVILDRTFRTHEQLVRSLDPVFARTLGPLHQLLTAERVPAPHDGPFIEASSFIDDDADIVQLRNLESRYVASEIARMLSDGLVVWDRSEKIHRPVRPSDIAILSRARAPLDLYIDDLLKAGIPAVNTGGGNLLETQVAKDVSVLLRFASDPADDIALVAILRSPFFAVSDVVLYELSRQKQMNETWWQLTLRSGSTVDRERDLLERLLAISKNVTALQFIQAADEMTGYTAVMANLDQGERRLADWFGFVDLLRRFASLGRSDVVGADRYLKELIAAEVTIPRPPLDARNAVSLMTIHAAKGLEWPIVFVPNLSAEARGSSSTVVYDAECGIGFKVIVQKDDGTYKKEEPSVYGVLKRQKKDAEDAESRRLLYVAMTRAQDRLYLTSAGKEANNFSLLADGLADAGVDVQRHDLRFIPEAHIWKREIDASPSDVHEQLVAVSPVLSSIGATGLSEYSICPKRFKFRHVDGHIGAGEGHAAEAALIGTLTHTALELGLRTADELRPLSGGANDEIISTAMRLAEKFYSGDEFLPFRTGLPKKEARRS
ncbi:MAG TPA: UvrD-helicase domain-containing protein, partial [Pyrinomonadaceae bacterium]